MITNVLVVSAVVIAIWALGKGLNYEFALLPSLAISVAATCLLSIVMGLLSKS